MTRSSSIKYEVTVRFELDDGPQNWRDRKELFEFIVDALESWGGQRHPEDWLFGSLEKVRVLNLKRRD